MTLQTPRSFNSWLRSQLKEKKMSQRQLALQSGVDHSTISRLIKGDRMPSLGTATRLARGLREIHDEGEGPAYFASQSARQTLPTARVEYALRADDNLTEADVRDLAHDARADSGQRGVLRRDDPAAVEPTEHQRENAMRVASGVQRVLVAEDQAERALQVGQQLHGRGLQAGVGGATRQ